MGQGLRGALALGCHGRDLELRPGGSGVGSSPSLSLHRPPGPGFDGHFAAAGGPSCGFTSGPACSLSCVHPFISNRAGRLTVGVTLSEATVSAVISAGQHLAGQSCPRMHVALVFSLSDSSHCGEGSRPTIGILTFPLLSQGLL